MEPAETIRGRDWIGFTHIPPATVLMICPEQQFAEKLHAYTFPRLVTPNSRVRDLVDMLLLIESKTLSMERTNEAIAGTFGRRGTHPIPSALQPPRKEWEKPFSALAAECGIQTDVDLTFKTIDAFYRSLRKSQNLRGRQL
jgi:hypothetical protein